MIGDKLGKVNSGLSVLALHLPHRGGLVSSQEKSCWFLQNGSSKPIPVLFGTLNVGTFGCALSSITKSQSHLLVTCLSHALSSKLTVTRHPTLPTTHDEPMGAWQWHPRNGAGRFPQWPPVCPDRKLTGTSATTGDEAPALHWRRWRPSPQLCPEHCLKSPRSLAAEQALMKTPDFVYPTPPPRITLCTL